MYFRVLQCCLVVLSVGGLVMGQSPPRSAIAYLTSVNVTGGAVTFVEQEGGVRVTGVVHGLAPGNYGFHIHELGNIQTCDAAGPHFNPDATTHGGRNHTVRHAGDFGNVQFVVTNTSAGVANIDFIDSVIALRGRNNVLGRALVLHANEDDLGLGGHALSNTTGNAGPRVACAVIGILSPAEPWNGASNFGPSSILLSLTALYYVIRKID